MSKRTAYEDRDAAYSRAARAFSLSYMNNVKWNRLFSVLAAIKDPIEYAEWWFIDDVEPVIQRLPRVGEFLERRFADGYFQPVEYRWIERIRIPRSWRPIRDVGFEREQNLQCVWTAVTAAGSFELSWEADRSALTMFGYKR